METVLYDATWKKKKPLALVRRFGCGAPNPPTERRSGSGVGQGPQNRLKEYLVSGWGIICRAPQNFLALGRRFGCRAGVRISFSELSLGLLRNLRGKQAYTYSYSKAPPYILYTKYQILSFVKSIANALLILSLAGLILIFYPVVQVELGYRLRKTVPKEPPVARAYFGDLLEWSNCSPRCSLGEPLPAPDPNFSLVIPKIEARSKIIAEVDPTNQTSYTQALKLGVGHAAGSSYPGKDGTIWLFAHSTDAPWNITRYNAVFYLLKELEPGDQIVVFYLGRRFNYQVFTKKILEANDTSFLKNEDEERLVLQTCWPPGTSLRRLIVLAKPTR